MIPGVSEFKFINLLMLGPPVVLISVELGTIDSFRYLKFNNLSCCPSVVVVINH